MERWILIDLGIIFLYGMQHTLLTTKIAVNLYNKFLPAFSWNIVYSIISVLTLVVGFVFWESSGVYIFHLIPGSLMYHVSVIALALSLFLFFYCFRYTTSFWQWLGIKQVAAHVRGIKAPEYYRVRKEGIKKYIRFPHHTCLIVLFWTHPVMTLDTLLLAVGATVYLYLGTYHQDLRGLAAIGDDWAEYRKSTALLLPGPKQLKRMWKDLTGADENVTDGQQIESELAERS